MSFSRSKQIAFNMPRSSIYTHLLASAAVSSVASALQSIIPSQQYSTNVQEATLGPINWTQVKTPENVVLNTTTNDDDEQLEIFWVYHEPRIPFIPRDFFLNCIGDIYRIASKDSDPTAMEKAKWLSNRGAENVRVMIGGGQGAGLPLPRARYLTILYKMMDHVTRNIGFEDFIADIKVAGSGEIVAHFEVHSNIPRGAGGRYSLPGYSIPSCVFAFGV